MKSNIIPKFIFLVVMVCYALSAAAQTSDAIKVGGALSKPYLLTMADFQKMPRVKVSRKDRDSTDFQYSGVLLSTILAKGGATLGKDLRRENLTKYVIVEAIDGYQVVFSLAELDSDFSDEKIILADTIDNEPLLSTDGPFRIIVEHDKRPARCIKQVTSIKIEFAK
ncbi:MULTISPECIES: molybdopterin-dependent oxidoreductase [Pedobacter]|uniref:molybdopterin-dependent oxidoreductase n=1 Tax=Pedobacter TaxID=84567 RepID=UPI001E35E8F0|nr:MULTISPECIES: molybdopterin-dependent oxidoreductase [Pedobacter]